MLVLFYMLKDLYTGSLPAFIDLNNLSLKEHNWEVLLGIWKQCEWSKPQYPIDFIHINDDKDGYCWQINERLRNGELLLTRSCVNYHRDTKKDTYGLLGLSLINPLDDRVILTEGVSDFFTAKFLCPKSNVLGVTTLSGSATAKKILLTLFNKFIICADNDTQGERNTGMNNAQNLSKFLKQFNKSVTIFTPQTGYKDITDNFIYCLKLNKYS